MKTPTTADPADVHVGARIAQLRIARGLTQSDLAKRAGGLTFQQFQKYESGANRVSASRLLQVAVALGVPVAYFFEGLPGAAGPDATGENLLVGFLETGGDVFTTERVLDEVVPEWRDLPEPGIRPEPADLGLPRDVVELVLAARAVAFADSPPDDADLKRLDSASEAFASRVPWDDEPEGAA